jgi:hypothetical protein
MKTNMKTTITICAVFLMAFAFYSCENPVALGSKLNLDPPTVVITEPDFMKNIKGDTLVIKGTAKDLQEIVYLNITIEQTKEGFPWKQEWNGERGSWRSRSNDGAWESSQGLWTGKNQIEWSIEVPMVDALGSRAPEGEYLITVGAQNDVRNEGPVAQRRVIIDNTPPVVNVTLPVLFPEDTEESYVYSDVETEFDAYNLRDLAVLEKLHNRSIKFQYEVDDDFSLASLEFSLRDSDGEIVAAKSAGSSWSGTVTFTAAEINLSAKTYLQLVSDAEDIAGNRPSKLRDHGWFVWWPDADFPWAEGVGDWNVDKSAGGGSTDDMTQVFPSSLVRGQSFDNQGVESVSYKVIEWDGSAYAIDYSSGTLPNEPLVPGSDPSKFFSWGFNAPANPNKYKVEVITQDIYKNKTTDIFYFYVMPIATGPLLVSFSGNPPGTYGKNDTIVITLHMREPVHVAGPLSLALNTTPARNADFDTDSNDSTQLKFTYQIQAGDSVAGDDVLKVTAINMTGVTLTRPDSYPAYSLTGDMPLNKDTPTTGWENQGLEYYTSIRISTNDPELVSATLTGTTLTLLYNKTIYKASGNITLAQAAGTFIAPAVLTASDYFRFGGDANLGNYYDRGTNGAREISAGSNTWEADPSEKYILKYDTNPDDSALRTRLENFNADKIIIPVVSGAVQVGGLNNNSLIVDLSDTWGYVLRVKGVSYTVELDSNLVRDDQNIPVEEDHSKTIANPGVNAPFIRVRKDQGEHTTRSFTVGTVTSHHVVATQQYRTQVRIDCQTPGVTINYTIGSVTTAPFEGTFTGGHPAPNINTAMSATNVANNLNYSAGFALGPTDNADRNGYAYGIRATASLASQTSATARAIAARSVVQFRNLNGTGFVGDLRADAYNRTPREVLQVWIRGGDQSTGGNNNTPGFPLSWDESDLSGARLFTSDSSTYYGDGVNATLWYWISWDVNATAYFHFLAGSTLTTNSNTGQNLTDLTNDFKQGPRRWCWGKNRWAFQYEMYKLYPGGSISMERGSTADGQATDYFEFFGSFKKKRSDVPGTEPSL